MLGQPSTDAVLNPGSVPGVASIDTAGAHAPYAWALARERSTPSPTATGVVESQDTPASAAARAPQSDRIAFFVSIPHLHERDSGAPPRSGRGVTSGRYPPRRSRGEELERH